MKKYSFTILYLFGFLMSFCQGDMTMYFSTNVNPAFPGQIEIKLHSTVAYPIGSSINFEVSLPPLTTIGTWTPVLSGVVSVGSNTFGLTSALPAMSAGGEIVLGRFTWVTSAAPGTTGTFGILDNSNNYIEYGDPALERQGMPLNNALAVPLPIKLRTFSAIKDGNRSSKLNWVSSSEVNSDYFGVERSKDGNTWEAIGRVNAAGNSNTDLAYEYFDRNLPMSRNRDNIYYYRLKLTDQDGYFKYSDIRGVNFGKVSGDVISIYPNPTYEVINVDLSDMDMLEGDIHLSVFDNAGRSMIQKNITGNGIELIEVNQYPAGTYNVMVKQGDTVHQKKIIKIN